MELILESNLELSLELSKGTMFLLLRASPSLKKVNFSLTFIYFWVYFCYNFYVIKYFKKGECDMLKKQTSKTQTLITSFLLFCGFIGAVNAEHSIAEEKETRLTEKGNTMSEEKLAGKWAQVVGKIKEKWGDLTDQDLEKVKGKKDQLVGLIQQKYGETKEEVEKKVNNLLDKMKD